MRQDVYIINLKSRDDRWRDIVANIKANSKIINPIRYEAVLASPGYIGCALSHIGVIETAKKAGAPYVVVFEDDTKFIHPCFDQYFEKILQYLQSDNQWQIFNGNPSCCSEQARQQVSIINRNPTIVSFEFGYTTNFMIYSSRVYDKIIGLKDLYTKPPRNPKDTAIDVLLNSIPYKVTHLPYLTSQAAGKSDITGGIISYDKYILVGGMHFLRLRTGIL